MLDLPNQALLGAIVETAVDGIIVIDGTGQVLMFNPACERLFGYVAVEVVGQNVKMLMPAPYRQEHDTYLDSYPRTGVRKIIGIGREVVGQRKDGSAFPMDLSVGEARDAGQPVFVGIIHDLTERKRVEQALRDTAARLRAVIDTAVDGVILIDARGAVLQFNPACETLFGYRAEEVIGENVKMLMPAPYRGEHDGYIDAYRRTREAKIIGIGRDVVGQRKDGSTFPMNLSVGEAKQDGESIFVGIVHDLTERKRTEEQLVQAQKMEAVGQLSGGIAHDFNNLLTVICGSAELLAERLRARPDLQQLAATIAAAGARGAELTQRLLAFSRRQILRPAEVDCSRLVERMRELLRRALREDIVIELMLDPDLHPAYADAAQLESAILNLALNARDAMPRGGHLTLATSNVELDASYSQINPEVRPGPYVLISVTDDGDGMSPEVLERAFEPFFTTKDVGKGSGLGLSMVYGFVKQSNGHVSIYSEPGLGTTVRLYLPAVASPGAAAGPEAQREAPAEVGAPGGAQATVLVAEDDPFVRSYAISSLKSLGYAVIAAVDGADALALIGRGAAPDVLFTDIVMPGGVSGWELADQARRMRPDLRVLFTSGYAIETLKSRIKLPADGTFLNKPYRKADLERALRHVLAALA